MFTPAPLKGNGASDRRVALSFAMCAVGLAIVAGAPSAHAQTQDLDALVRVLTEGVRCQDSDAKADLSFNVAEVQSAAAEMIADALETISADEATCEPVRLAALAMVNEMISRAEPDADVSDPARALVDASLAEADQRAAALKFEVGPPPLNLSRGRKGGS